MASPHGDHVEAKPAAIASRAATTTTGVCRTTNSPPTAVPAMTTRTFARSMESGRLAGSSIDDGGAPVGASIAPCGLRAIVGARQARITAGWAAPTTVPVAYRDPRVITWIFAAPRPVRVPRSGTRTHVDRISAVAACADLPVDSAEYPVPTAYRLDRRYPSINW